MFTQSGFAFVGSGEILEVQAIDGGSSDARVKVYDAANPNFSEHDKRVDRRYNDAIPMRPVMFERGAYVQLAGTNPQAIVRIGVVNEFDFLGDDILESMGSTRPPRRAGRKAPPPSRAALRLVS